MSGIGGWMNMLRNAKDLMEKAKGAQAELAKISVEGQAGAGLVVAKMNGLGELIGMEFDKSAVNPGDVEMLSDLVIGAVADARRKIAELRSKTIAELTGGIDLSALGIDPGRFM